MAYHTRRSGPQGIGWKIAGRGASPIMYSQRPNTRSQPYGNARNMNSMQSSQNMPGNYSQQSHPQSGGPNYSGQQQQTQQPPQQQQSQPSQQQQQPPPQQQQQQQQPPPQQQQPPPQQQSSQQQQQQQQPPQQQAPTITPVGKVEDTSQSATPTQSVGGESVAAPTSASDSSVAPAEDQNLSMDVKTEMESEVENEPKPKPWLKKKVPGFKVNKKVKRRRQNARLRKILQPKNAIMVLNELKAGIKFTFQEHTNALTQTMFVVNAEVDGKTYTGQGLSKPLAKQNAAENALKDLLLQKMADAAMKVMNESGDTPPEPMVVETNNASGDTDSVDGASDAGKPGAPEDDVPWGSLASFALYKLFTEWQSQGTHVPITPTGTPAATPAKANAPAPMKKIPDNPTERHPVMLLNQLRPGVEFKEVSREGLPPNLIFTLRVDVDGAAYTGVAKNKKDAKKEAAKAALAGSFNINYD